MGSAPSAIAAGDGAPPMDVETFGHLRKSYDKWMADFQAEGKEPTDEELLTLLVMERDLLLRRREPPGAGAADATDNPEASMPAAAGALALLPQHLPRGARAAAGRSMRSDARSGR